MHSDYGILYESMRRKSEVLQESKLHEKLLRNAMQDRLHQHYRKSLIMDYDQIEALVRSTGAAFCLSGAGPTLLCITQDSRLEEKLNQKLDTITQANWKMLPLHVDFQGAHILDEE